MTRVITLPGPINVTTTDEDMEHTTYPRMWCEIERLKSFPLAWDSGVPRHKAHLAKEGFYWTGSGLVCRCAFCSALLDAGVQRDGLVPQQHRRLAPSCPVVLDTCTLNVPINTDFNYSLEEGRLASLLAVQWNKTAEDPQELASRGFYWTGRAAHEVCCAFCQMCLAPDGTHSLSQDHELYKPYCPALTQNRYRSHLMTQ